MGQPIIISKYDGGNKPEEQVAACCNNPGELLMACTNAGAAGAVRSILKVKLIEFTGTLDIR